MRSFRLMSLNMRSPCSKWDEVAGSLLLRDRGRRILPPRDVRAGPEQRRLPFAAAVYAETLHKDQAIQLKDKRRWPGFEARSPHLKEPLPETYSIQRIALALNPAYPLKLEGLFCGGFP